MRNKKGNWIKKCSTRCEETILLAQQEEMDITQTINFEVNDFQNLDELLHGVAWYKSIYTSGMSPKIGRGFAKKPALVGAICVDPKRQASQESKNKQRRKKVAICTMKSQTS